MSRISGTFDELRGRGRKAVIPYVVAGIPVQREPSRYFMSWLNPAPMCWRSACAFSDPMAEGPVIKKVTSAPLPMA